MIRSIIVLVCQARTHPHIQFKNPPPFVVFRHISGTPRKNRYLRWFYIPWRRNCDDRLHLSADRLGYVVIAESVHIGSDVILVSYEFDKDILINILTLDELV